MEPDACTLHECVVIDVTSDNSEMTSADTRFVIMISNVAVRTSDSQRCGRQFDPRPEQSRKRTNFLRRTAGEVHRGTAHRVLAAARQLRRQLGALSRRRREALALPGRICDLTSISGSYGMGV